MTERGTLPSGWKPKPPEGLKEARGTMPKGFNKFVADDDYYLANATCDNCGEIANIGVPHGMKREDAFKKIPCPQCGCKIIQTNFLGIRKRRTRY